MKKTNSQVLAKKLSITKARSMEAIIKAELISAVLDVVERGNITHAEIAEKSGLPRSAVTGILSGSLQKVTIDRVLKLVEAVDLVAKVQVKKVA
jgi:predicted XRE-type DNA-binding protein